MVGDLTAHFDRREFACKCGCGENRIDPDFVWLLEIARGISGCAYIITSGYRCREHDREMGGKGNHPTGLAADIQVNGSYTRALILDGLLRAGFRRIGIGARFIHVDAVPDRPSPRIWLY